MTGIEMVQPAQAAPPTTSPDKAGWQGVRQRLAFVRHIPAGKLLRRVELEIRRRVRDRLPAVVGRSRLAAQGKQPPACAAGEPAPVFAPRTTHRPLRRDNGWVFTFLNRSIAMAGPGVDWQAPSRAPADQLWRMHLHYMEYLEAVDDAEWGLLVRDWIASNPADRPGAWRDSWNSFALSLRVVVWLQELARRKGRLPKELVILAVDSAVEQIRYLLRNLETDLGGNHLVKNIKALIWASACFQGPEPERWRRTGVRLLEREIAAQILPDGMHYERSASYHAQVLADLVECRHALGADPIAGRLDHALAVMAQALADMTHPDGRVALFNDAGLSVAYPSAECLDAAAQLIGKPAAPRALFALDAAGYYGVRSPAGYVVFDCGRIAPDDLPAHGHADVLSFEWSVDGQRMIVDQGVFEYIAGDRRTKSQASRSHNTLFIEGADQADFFGAFRCGRRPNIERCRFTAAANGFTLEGAHDGYAHLPGRLRHVRRADIRPDCVELRDTLEGETRRAAAIGFLLHPQCQVSLTGGTATIARGRVRIAVSSTGCIRIEPAVWWPDLGLELATHRLVIDMQPGLRTLDTRLVAETAAPPATTEVPAS